jgi:hypothetical protein
VPSFSGTAELSEVATYHLADPEARAAAVTKLRAAVLAGHGWRSRAATLDDQLRRAAARLRFGIKLPDTARAEDEALLLALRRLGHAARLDEPLSWMDGIGAGDDVSLVVSQTPDFEPDPRALTLWWPPGLVAAPLPPGFDHAFLDLAAPVAGDTDGWNALAGQILTVTEQLLFGIRIG